MMNKYILGIVALIIIGGGAYYFLSKENPAYMGHDEASESESHDHDMDMSAGDDADTGEVAATGEDVVITYTDDGFSPSQVSVKAGTRVVFKNESSRDFWPASAQHPTHIVYSGTSLSEHCGDVEDVSFDACEKVAPGESYSFVFTKVGEWGYHDHLRANETGKVVVNE